MTTYSPMNPPTESILIVDDEDLTLNLLKDILEYEGYKTFLASNGVEAIKSFKSNHPDLVLMDVNMPGLDGFAVCKHLKSDENTENIPVIFISGMNELPDKYNAFSSGGLDYITKPFAPLEILVRVKTHLTISRLRNELINANSSLEEKIGTRTKALHESNIQLKREITEREKAKEELKNALRELENIKNRLEEKNDYLQQELKLEHNFEEIIGTSKSLKKVLKTVEQIAATDSTVLITGETGTGKELIARALHNLSKRKNEPLVKVNCASLPTNLIESELFGHEKGAFTGAINAHKGRFEIAHNSTIFLDEIGEMPQDVQTKLLRVLQEGEFEHVGGERTIKTDVRIIAATNRDLENMVSENKFRHDLYYRLNVLPIHLSPLRERREDIKPLTCHFVAKCSKNLGKNFKDISLDSLDMLRSHSWPGNIRELENIVERAVIFSKEPTLTLEPSVFLKNNSVQHQNGPVTLEDLEKKHIRQILDKTNWVIHGSNGAAALLKINPSTLRSRMKKLGLERPKMSGYLSK